MENPKKKIPDEILEEVSGGANHSPTGAGLPSSGQVSSSARNESNLPPDLPESGNTIHSPIDIRKDMLIGKEYEGPWNMSTIEAEMNNIGLKNL